MEEVEGVYRSEAGQPSGPMSSLWKGGTRKSDYLYMFPRVRAMKKADNWTFVPRFLPSWPVDVSKCAMGQRDLGSARCSPDMVHREGQGTERTST